MPITRALSVKQPFAELIIAGKKKSEHRTVPTRIRERVYVYASKKPGPKKRWKESGYELGSLPSGVLVGTVEVVGCKGVHGAYEWKLACPKRLKRALKPKRRPQPVWFRPF